ncbi:hypothetical protein G5B30_09950 [Sphingobacterium sp. SGG-5]|uniref:hypothetical protein n=1 Tax=Sphingobacterium sp. SGG-5 TaxID=2710881 RepID=UPI0013EBB72B|nr:hypothetical protein [Sphingobacterium sp. SGG-5]NGM62237.1 hypothetical protein [Sphingobacterium sp. SGG-5]
MKKVREIKKRGIASWMGALLVMFLLNMPGQAAAQQAVFEDNFDDGKSLEALGYRPGAAQGMSERPVISSDRSASGENSVFFAVKQLNLRKKFDNVGVPNATVEWKVNVPEMGGSFGISLYNGRDAVVKTNMFSKNLIYINDANEKNTLAPYSANEWVTVRIAITGNKYNVYMNDKLVGENIPTLGGHTKVNTIFYSVGNKAAYIDDVRVLRN